MVILTVAIAAVIVVIDQLIKFLVVNTVKVDDAYYSVFGGIVNIMYVENKGVAFGLMENYRWLFIIMTSVIIIALLVFLFKKKPKSKFFNFSCALIIGGGIGNLIDRIFLGYVVDYIQLSFFPPVCNFADYCVTFGTAMLIIYILFFTDFLSKDSKKKLSE